VRIQIYSNVNGKPLDAPEFRPVFKAMELLGKPVGFIPARTASFPDYQTEEQSLYEIWWTFGWPYESSAAQARIVFSKMLDEMPNLKIIIHHAGGMTPFFEGRVGPGWDQLGARTSFRDYKPLLKELKKRPLDYFKMFYADTATFGSKAALVCALSFYGIEHVLFASDAPFDPEGGPMYIRETLRVIDGLDMSKEDREKIYFKNACRPARYPLRTEPGAIGNTGSGRITPKLIPAGRPVVRNINEHRLYLPDLSTRYLNISLSSTACEGEICISTMASTIPRCSSSTG